jgi:hypothetical protein
MQLLKHSRRFRFIVISTFVLFLLPLQAKGDSTLINNSVAELMGYLQLSPTDLSFRPDYTDPDSFRLQLVADLMTRPMGMQGYARTLRASYIPQQPFYLAQAMVADLKTVRSDERPTAITGAYVPTSEELATAPNLYYSNLQLNQFLTKMERHLSLILPRSTDKSLAMINDKEKRFLKQEFLESIRIDPGEETLSVAALDSIEKLDEETAKRFVSFGYKVSTDPILYASLDLLRDLWTEVGEMQRLLAKGEVTPAELMRSGAVTLAGEKESNFLGRDKGWAIGGAGNDVYTGSYRFILDLGGDDTYRLSADSGQPCVIVDLSGNDLYVGKTDFVIGAGHFSAGILLDYGGHDVYRAKSFSIGSGYFGFGMLYDAAGDDIYEGDTHIMAAATEGLGILIDEAGHDTYRAAAYAQGFGYVQGMGVLIDATGSDQYFAGGKYQDVLRYEDRYISMSQGFGFGIRPYTSGGIGALIDLGGTDQYVTDIFGQGASYWWSLGILIDSGGNDTYRCHQYGQGTGTHMTLGYLLDQRGNDYYVGKGLMQGVGHDYSAGLCIDEAGDDTYLAADLSQGAGSANGFGVLVDLMGADRYLVINPDNTHGYGNPRRDFGSIGLMIDLGGTDQYQGLGMNSGYWRTNSSWGGGMDLPDTSLVPKPVMTMTKNGDSK